MPDEDRTDLDPRAAKQAVPALWRLRGSLRGPEKIVGTLAEGFAQRGHEVLLVGAKGSSAKGATVLELPAGKGDEQCLAAYQEALLKVDVVQSHDWQHWPATLWMRDPDRYRDVRLQILHHGVLGDIQAAPPLEHPNWTCFSAAQANTVSCQLRIATRHVHHGVDTDVFRPGPRDEGYYLILSRLSPEKGVHEALRILKQARKRVVLIADDRFIADPQYVRQVLGMCDGYLVRFVSGTNMTLDQQVAWVQGAHALVHTPLAPWMEVFGLTVAEALACGVPVLATRNGAIPEIIQDGETGFLADTPDGLSEVLDRVQDLDRATCRWRAVERFSIPRMVDDHLRLLDDVLNGREW